MHSVLPLRTQLILVFISRFESRAYDYDYSTSVHFFFFFAISITPEITQFGRYMPIKNKHLVSNVVVLWTILFSYLSKITYLYLKSYIRLRVVVLFSIFLLTLDGSHRNRSHSHPWRKYGVLESKSDYLHCSRQLRLPAVITER